MRKTIAVILTAALLIMPVHAGTPSTSAHSAILIHADTGKVLYEQNADDRMLIASTTKIITAIVVLENCALDETVEIDSRSAGTEGSSMYLREGETYTVEELLYGLMLVSGNDAAMALALHTAGSLEKFAGLMNDKAVELGMTGSHFANPHGLDAEGHYSTARDMAVLAAYCMENDDFACIVSSRSASVHGNELYNHNKLLGMYDGCIGIKTGYTMAAGRTLVSCAERGDTRFICVTLCDRDDWDDHAALYDWAFENYEYVRVVDSGTVYHVPAVSGEEAYAHVRAAEDGYALLSRGEEWSVSLELPPFVICPIYAGEKSGSISVTAGGDAVCTVPLVYANNMPAVVSGGGFISRLERLWDGLGFGKALYLTGD